MSAITATDAKRKFGQVLAQAQHEAVHVQKHGREVAVVVSAAEYQRLIAADAACKFSPRVQQLLAENIAPPGLRSASQVGGIDRP